MSIQRARIYLDVDSTILVPPSPSTITVSLDELEFDIQPEVVNRLAEISQDPHTEFVWCTAWGETARLLEPLLGIFAEGVVPGEDTPEDEGQYWKALGIQAMQDADWIPFVWLDDLAITDELLRLPWWREKSRLNEVLLLPCSPQTGLTMEDIERVEIFLDRNTCWG